MLNKNDVFKKQLWLCDVIIKLRLGNFSCIRLLIIVGFYIFVLQAKIKVYLSDFSQPLKKKLRSVKFISKKGFKIQQTIRLCF